MSTQTFLNSGTWTCPGGVSSVQVQCWGAGGGAGGQSAIVHGDPACGGGGGGGAYAIKTVAVVAGATYAVNVGNKGLYGAVGFNGNAGGDTWFYTTVTVLSRGGSGGASADAGRLGGPGGNSTNCIGDTCYTGGSGGTGATDPVSIGGAGGGSSAGTGSNGNNGASAAGGAGAAGGAAPTGGGAGGSGGTGGAAGTPGFAPGGGGGSAAGESGASSGKGEDGQVTLTWTAVSGPVAKPAMIVRRDDEIEIARAPKPFNPSLAMRWTKPVALGTMIVREVEPLPILPGPLLIFQSPQRGARTAAGPSTPRGTRIVQSFTHELERVGVAIAQFIRPRLALIDYGTRYGSARTVYRIFAPAVYRFYRSNTATPPQPGDTPYATSATLPNQPATLFADGTWLISVSYFNGVIDSGFYPIGPRGETYVTLTITGGMAQPTLPGAPMGARLEVRAGGVIRVIAYYLALADGANAADTWGIAYTTNGTTPPSGAASVTQAMTAGPFQILSYDLPAQADGMVVKVQLQTIRSTGTVYSTPGAVLQATAVANGPSGPLGIQDWPGFIPEDLA